MIPTTLQVTEIPKGIPWEIIGGGGALALVIIIVVLGFLLKWKKTNGRKTVAVPTNPGNYPCMEHTKDIATNAADIEAGEKSINLLRTENSKAHDKIFKKLDTMQTDIIKAINGGKE